MPIVKMENAKEGKLFFDYLEAQGFNNIQNLDYESLSTKVLVVNDSEKYFFGINVTGLAAGKPKLISVEQFKKAYEQNPNRNDEQE